METDKRVMTMKENLTLEIVEERLKKIAKAHGLDLMDERVPWHYGKEYGGLPNEISDYLSTLWICDKRSVRCY